MEVRKISLYSGLFFFLIFMPLLITLLPIEKWLIYHPFFLIILIVYLSVLYFFYNWVNIPRLLLERKYLRGLGWLALVLFITYVFVHVNESPDVCEDMMKAVRNRQRTVWFLTVIVTVYCFSNNLLVELFKQTISKQEMEADKNTAELALYKAQINPHFLFNTLNTLYGLLITHSDKTEIAFENFINLTKYAYRNANRDLIPIHEEVSYISQYVELQSLRLNEFNDVSFEHEIENPEILLPPMLLITFVENAFKYGISSREKSHVLVRMLQSGSELHFYVENKIFVRESGESKKMGIENCRKRLALLYPQRHQLNITTENGLFKVELQLTLA